MSWLFEKKLGFTRGEQMIRHLDSVFEPSDFGGLKPLSNLVLDEIASIVGQSRRQVSEKLAHVINRDGPEIIRLKLLQKHHQRKLGKLVKGKQKLSSSEVQSATAHAGEFDKADLRLKKFYAQIFQAFGLDVPPQLRETEVGKMVLERRKGFDKLMAEKRMQEQSRPRRSGPGLTIRLSKNEQRARKHRGR